MLPSLLTATSASNRSGSSPLRVGRAPSAVRPASSAPSKPLRKRWAKASSIRTRASSRGSDTAWPKRFLEHRYGEVVELELREQDECFGAERAFLDFREHFGRDRSRARPLAGDELRSSRCECSTPALVLLVGRRQPERLLGQLRRQRRRAAFCLESCGAVEQTGDVGVGHSARQREVTSACDRIVNDLRDLGMDRPASLRAEVVVEGCGQQWRRTNSPVVTVDDARGDGIVQRARGNSRL